MRGTLPEAREVLDMHTQLLNDLNVRNSSLKKNGIIRFKSGHVRSLVIIETVTTYSLFLLLSSQMKGSEIEALLRSVNPLCEMAEEAQAHEVQMKGDLLHDTWQKLRRALADRVELMQSYVRLHGLAMAVQEAWDDVETKCQQLDQDPSLAIRQVEELWLDGQQKYLQLSQLGRNFMADALQVIIYIVSSIYLLIFQRPFIIQSLEGLISK